MRHFIARAAITALMTATGVLAGVEPAYNYEPHTIKTCNQYLAWNPSLDKDICTPFSLEQSYCVGICEKNCTTSTSTTSTASSTSTTKSASSSSTSTTARSAVATPTPVQDGIVKGCQAFTLVTTGSTCTEVANQYGLTVSELVALNPAFKADYSGIKTGFYAYVGVQCELPPEFAV
ncbi:hypothetical protein B0T22DRAFT_479933 [Podospora appendiculata]|uniref:LysM domain-containing protein n=1 Tax=Podospora appendiculata TaxID=314037 RepID=A0AAE0X9S0_9PEZI|nr:hypothetical protein B0T22DRAFT_479933 [Podospora appendiculata]